MGWKDVPMPPRIAALPRDRRGFPVPWISDWEDDAVDHGKAWSLTEGHPVYGTYTSACIHVDGVGEPNLGALCAPRQIQGMVDRLCDVCGVKVGKTAFFMGGEACKDTGFFELPLHLECALYAGQVCPGLVTKAGEIWVTSTESYRCDMRRMFYPNVNRDFHGLNDPAWRLAERFYGPSILTGIIAVPDSPDLRRLPLEGFLAEHRQSHPLPKGERMTHRFIGNYS